MTRDYLAEHVLSEVVRCGGPQLPCYSADKILTEFWDRFGPRGMAICRQAFEVHNGMWRGAPVTVLRFQASHDPYFALPLLAEADSAREA